ncbi:MAG: putative DNA binding domain-containing protein [Dehalococcoidia bacterium]|nr:putative DNA binding domain-containing protein [Dehalococcoidia bacterium]
MTGTHDNSLSKPSAELTAAALEALVGTVPEPQRYALLAAWSRERAAAEAAALANTAGGLLLVGVEVDTGGAVKGFTDGGTQMANEIGLLAGDLGPVGRHLLAAAILEVGGKSVGVIRVAEAPAPPVMVETDGGVYRRTAAGCVRVTTRAELDALTGKDRASRERAEKNLTAMVSRNELGNYAYVTLAVTLAPRVPDAGPYAWAAANRPALVAHEHGLAGRWQFASENVSASAGEILVAGSDEVTGFLRISRNGTVAAGEHLRRPPGAAFLPAADMASRLRDMVELATLPLRAVGGGQVVAAVSLEGMRDLRLTLADGLSRPASRDTLTSIVTERHLADDAELARLSDDLVAAAGVVFAANLGAGTGAHAGDPVDHTGDPRSWHGLTRRTERRLSGARGHGSAG